MGYELKNEQRNKMGSYTQNKPVITSNQKLTPKPISSSVIVSTYIERDRIPAVRNIKHVYDSYVRKVTDVLETDQWTGKRCFILGGGNSLRGFDFKQLDGELTIGVNRIFQFYDPTLFYSMDTRFHGWVVNGYIDRHDQTNVKEKWINFTSKRIFLCPLTIYDFKDGTYVVNRLLDVVISRDLKAGLFGGNNSGFGALMLAIALGANPIYLLGFDCKADTNTHFHSGYPGQQIENLRIKLESYRKQMHDVAPTISNMGFKVVNLNSDSGITCFEFDTIDNVLNNKEV